MIHLFPGLDYEPCVEILLESFVSENSIFKVEGFVLNLKEMTKKKNNLSKC